MKNRYLICAGAAAAMAMLLFVAAPKAQQRANPRQEAAAAKPTPKMADGHPDFSGFWLDNVAGISYQNNDGASEDGNLKAAARWIDDFPLRRSASWTSGRSACQHGHPQQRSSL